MPELNCTSPGITNCNHEEEITLVSAHLLHVDTLPHAAWSWKGRCRGRFPLLFLLLYSESRWVMGAEHRQLRRQQMRVHWQNGSGLCGRVASSSDLLVSVWGRMLWGHGDSRARRGTSEAHPLPVALNLLSISAVCNATWVWHFTHTCQGFGFFLGVDFYICDVLDKRN